MKTILARLICLFRGHRVFLYKADGQCAYKGRDNEGMLLADCCDCGKELKASCGLMLPGFRLGTAPKKTSSPHPLTPRRN